MQCNKDDIREQVFFLRDQFSRYWKKLLLDTYLFIIFKLVYLSHFTIAWQNYAPYSI